MAEQKILIQQEKNMAVNKAEFIEHREHREHRNPRIDNGTSAENDKNDNSVDRIRDIIFGAHIQDYSSRFSKISSQLDIIDKRLEQINERISEHERDIDSQLADQKKKFEIQLSQLDAGFSEQIEGVVLQNQHQTKALNDAITALGKQSKQDLQQATQELSDLKVDRSLLSDLFLACGHTGYFNFLNGLNQLQNPKKLNNQAANCVRVK